MSEVKNNDHGNQWREEAYYSGNSLESSIRNAPFLRWSRLSQQRIHWIDIRSVNKILNEKRDHQKEPGVAESVTHVYKSIDESSCYDELLPSTLVAHQARRDSR